MSARPCIKRLLVLALLPACSPARPPQDVAAVRTTIDSLVAAHARHFVEGKIDSLVDAYTGSVVVRPQNMPTVRGHDELRAALTAWLKAAPIKSIAYTTEELTVHGDTAFHINSYKATLQPQGSAEVTDTGRCTLLWLRDPKTGWKIHRSMCNSSGPPVPAKGSYVPGNNSKLEGES